MFFFRNHAENEAERLGADLLLFYKKSLYEVKANDLQLSFKIFRESSTWQTIKTKYMKFFYCLEKDLGIVSLPHFLYDFSRKMFLS